MITKALLSVVCARAPKVQICPKTFVDDCSLGAGRSEVKGRRNQQREAISSATSRRLPNSQPVALGRGRPFNDPNRFCVIFLPQAGKHCLRQQG